MCIPTLLEKYSLIPAIALTIEFRLGLILKKASNLMQAKKCFHYFDGQIHDDCEIVKVLCQSPGTRSVCK
jgi:hypothetical protein